MINYKNKYLKYKKKYLNAKNLYSGGGRNRKPPKRYDPSDYLPIEKKKNKIKSITKKNIQENIDGRSHLLPWIDSCTRVFAIWTHRALKYHWKWNPETRRGDDSNSNYYILQHWESHIDSFICYNGVNYGTIDLMSMIDYYIDIYMKSIHINMENKDARFKYFCKILLPTNPQCLSSIYDILYTNEHRLADVPLAHTLAAFFLLLNNTMNMLINFEHRYTNNLVVHASTFCSGTDKEGGHTPVLLNECPCCSKLKDLCSILDNWEKQENETSNIIQKLIEKIRIDIDNEEEEVWETDEIEYIQWKWFEDDINPNPFNDGSGRISFYVEQAWEDIGFGQYIDLSDINLMDEAKLCELVDDFYGLDEDFDDEQEEGEYDKQYEQGEYDKQYEQGEYDEEYDEEEYDEEYDQGAYDKQYEQGQGHGWDRFAGPLQENNDVWAAARK